MVVVTHELASAFLIADRMVYIEKGDIIALGTKEEFMANDHPRVRQFLDRRPEPEVVQEMDYLQMLTAEHKRKS
jgi:phospholipid/cholesterol/gamma-HCH transport system ATP-binding protein